MTIGNPLQSSAMTLSDYAADEVLEARRLLLVDRLSYKHSGYYMNRKSG